VNSQEREIISGIFQRLEQAASQPRDPETERLINDKIRQQPYAPYAMAQLIYVQEEAIKSLNQQVEELRAEVERRGQQSGGFLSSIFGGGPRPQPQRPAAGSPWGGQPQPGQPQPGPSYGQGYGPGGPQPGPWGGQQPGMMGGGGAGGGGFLRGALTTAAGVAGGMVVGNALMNAFKGGHESLGAFSPADASALSGGQTDLSSFSPFQDAGGGGAGFDSDAGGGFQDASFDSGGDAGGDFGGGGGSDDWT
jgi:hypothetical protein